MKERKYFPTGQLHILPSLKGASVKDGQSNPLVSDGVGKCLVVPGPLQESEDGNATSSAQKGRRTMGLWGKACVQIPFLTSHSEEDESGPMVMTTSGGLEVPYP